MKKYLYGTTALVALGLAVHPASAEVEPLHMELGGYFTSWYGYSDPDRAANGSSRVGEFSSVQNAEVHFRMRGELDNGLKIGGRIELKGETTGDQVDQHYLVLAGGFGEFRIGSVNSGRYSYGWLTDAPTAGIGINSGWMSGFVAPLNNSGLRFRSPSRSTVIEAGNDEPKITYFTPRFEGFQLIASWTPRGHLITGNLIGSGGSTFFFTGPADENIVYTNGLDIGISYVNDFDGIGVRLQAGAATADAPQFAENAALGSDVDDYFAYNGGIALSYLGWDIAASFAVVEEPLCLLFTATAVFPPGLCASSNEGDSFNIGVGYSTGPWQLTLSYFVGQEEGLRDFPGLGNQGDEKSRFVELGASYLIGPGLSTSLAVVGTSFDDDFPGAGGNNDGISVVWGIHAGF